MSSFASKSKNITAAIIGVVMMIIFGGNIPESYAAAQCKTEIANIVSIEGTIELRRAREILWQPVSMNMAVCAGDMIRARSHSRAALRLRNESMLRLDQRTSVIFPGLPEEKGAWLMDLLEGAIHIITRTPKPFKTRTPFVNASVEGTEFYVGLDGDAAKVVVYEGRVVASNEFGSIVLFAATWARRIMKKSAIILRKINLILPSTWIPKTQPHFSTMPFINRPSINQLQLYVKCRKRLN